MTAPATPTTSDPAVLTEDHGSVRVLTLNRPHKRNAIDWPLRTALAEALEAAAADRTVRAVVLTGAGRAFCSGGDVATMAALPRDDVHRRALAAQRVIHSIWATPKPVVAAVEGSAYGAGVALAAACDRVVSASDAVYAATFTRVGLAGDMGIFASLPARVGPSRARQLLMMGDPLSASTALAQGLVDSVVEPGQALASALVDAQRLAAGPPLALGAIKQMLSAEPRHPYAVLELEVDHQVELWQSADFVEGVAAFREKRRPIFGGDRS